jgi:ketol-acid reductoisomerase
MDWMYANCSATAQRGALDWRPKFKEATLPVFTELYRKVRSGEECVRVLKSTGADNYKQVLDAELKELGNSEMWRAGAAVRKLRPVK